MKVLVIYGTEKNKNNVPLNLRYYSSQIYVDNGIMYSCKTITLTIIFEGLHTPRRRLY